MLFCQPLIQSMAAAHTEASSLSTSSRLGMRRRTEFWPRGSNSRPEQVRTPCRSSRACRSIDSSSCVRVQMGTRSSVSRMERPLPRADLSARFAEANSAECEAGKSLSESAAAESTRAGSLTM